MAEEHIALVELRRVRDDIVNRLMTSPDYRALIAVDEAIMKLTAPRKLILKKRSIFDSPAVAAEAARSLDESITSVLQAGTRMRSADVALSILASTGTPMSVRALVHRLNRDGVGVTPGSLSSILSRDDRFASFQHDGNRLWWMKEKDLPPLSSLAAEPEEEDGDA